MLHSAPGSHFPEVFFIPHLHCHSPPPAERSAPVDVKGAIFFPRDLVMITIICRVWHVPSQKIVHEYDRKSWVKATESDLRVWFLFNKMTF